MMVVWLASSFDYYLILFLVNSFEWVYICAFVSSISEFIAYALSGMIYTRMGVSFSLAGSFGIAVIGGIIILAYGLDH